MARVAGLNPTYDNLSTSTIAKWWSRNFREVYASHHPFMYKLFELGNVFKGGTGYQWVDPFRHPSPNVNQTVGVADGYQDLPMPMPIGGITAYNWTPALFMFNVAIEIYDDLAQGEETTRIPYYESTMEQSMSAHMEKLQTMFWAPEGTPGSDGQRRDQLSSIRTLINGGGTLTTGGAIPIPKPKQLTAAVGVNPITRVGGIERNGPQGAYATPNIWYPATQEQPSLQSLGRVCNSASRNNGAVDLIIVGERLYGYYDSLVASQQSRPNQESRMAKMGFSTLRYKDADIIFDDNCPSIETGAANNEMFALQMKYIKLRYNTMKPTFVRKDFPNKALKNWQGSQMLQLCAESLGRDHARHARYADPA